MVLFGDWVLTEWTGWRWFWKSFEGVAQETGDRSNYKMHMFFYSKELPDL
jgi:hypothetical protein